MKRVCFVDDTEREVDLFNEVFGAEFDLLSICATTVGEVRKKLSTKKAWKPDLFILDLYFPLAREHQSVTRARVRQLPAFAPPPDDGDMTRAYLNYLAAERRLEDVLHAHNQSYEGGIGLFTSLKREKAYRDVPTIFYSRKATSIAIMECLATPGVRGVAKKPTAEDWPKTKELTRKASPQLLQLFEEMAGRSELELEMVRRVADSTLRAIRIAGDLFRIGKTVSDVPL